MHIQICPVVCMYIKEDTDRIMLTLRLVQRKVK